MVAWRLRQKLHRKRQANEFCPQADEVITAWGGSLATSIFAYAKGKTKEAGADTVVTVH